MLTTSSSTAVRASTKNVISTRKSPDDPLVDRDPVLGAVEDDRSEDDHGCGPHERDEATGTTTSGRPVAGRPVSRGRAGPVRRSARPG